MKKQEKTILWFKEVGKRDLLLVGGKGANLGEMLKAGIPVPQGFIVSSEAYFDFLKKGSLRQKIRNELSGLNIDDSKALNSASKNIKTAILAAKIPPKTAAEIKKAYRKLCGPIDKEVAVRSSATAEDLPEASFAGQFTTFLNVRGQKKLLKTVLKCWASLFNPRAIFYRAEKKFSLSKIGIGIPVQLMVDSEASGVAFTVDPLSNDPSKIAIEAIFGLGEAVVSGAITPDQYLLDKKTLKILDKKIAPQKWQITKEGKMPISKMFQKKQKLSDKKIKELAKICRKIEEHYQFPQDIEWGTSKRKLWVVQTRPVTTMEVRGQRLEVSDEVDERLLLKGIAASPGVASGSVRLVLSVKKIAEVKKGDVLVTGMTNPDFVPAMRKAVAIVTDRGGRTSHAAIVSRELGIPCIVGTDLATKMLKSGEVVTVDGSGGKVYEGKMKLRSISAKSAFDQRHLRTATKVYVNLSEPEAAAKIARRNVDGVGLLRAEFMIAEIGVHPRKVIEDKKSKDYVNKLAEGLATFAESFAPRPVIYRATDFKTSEYRHLKGGAKFEDEEANPFLGFRGAMRYLADPQVFDLELKAIKMVRNKMGFKNLHLMVPFVRTVEELAEVKKLVSVSGLRRSGNFWLWMMVEVPSNVILLEDFIKVGIDGVSVGSNDLTMLTLGIDRDNPKLAEGFDEFDPAVLWSVERVIKTCKKHKVTSSICGQAPSDFPELTKKLVAWGMTSVSVNPDAIEKTREIVYEAEKELVKRKKG